MKRAQPAIYDIDKIREIIPHRYPFLLLDKVIEVKEAAGPGDRLGRKAVAVKNVTINEPFFQGHFPGRPIMPGVLIVEAMAQVGGMAAYLPGDKPLSIVIASVNKARFRHPVIPGDQLHLTADVVRDRGSMILIRCKAEVDSQIVAQADILAHVSFQTS